MPHLKMRHVPAVQSAHEHVSAPDWTPKSKISAEKVIHAAPRDAACTRSFAYKRRPPPSQFRGRKIRLKSQKARAKLRSPEILPLSPTEALQKPRQNPDETPTIKLSPAPQ
jgi:hypothetical protein